MVADVGERSLRAPRERFLHAPGERFLLAPMSGLIRGLTCLALGVPGALVLGGFATPAPASTVLLGTAIFVVAIYGFVWGWLRPREFLVDAEALVIAFPWRERRIPRDSLGPAREITQAEFHAAYGFGVRVGAGGLWGGFGFLATRRGRVDLYVSRHDRFVLVERSGGPPLLLSPEPAHAFVACLGAPDAP